MNFVIDIGNLSMKMICKHRNTIYNLFDSSKPLLSQDLCQKTISSDLLIDVSDAKTITQLNADYAFINREQPTKHFSNKNSQLIVFSNYINALLTAEEKSLVPPELPLTLSNYNVQFSLFNVLLTLFKVLQKFILAFVAHQFKVKTYALDDAFVDIIISIKMSEKQKAYLLKVIKLGASRVAQDLNLRLHIDQVQLSNYLFGSGYEKQIELKQQDHIVIIDFGYTCKANHFQLDDSGQLITLPQYQCHFNIGLILKNLQQQFQNSTIFLENGTFWIKRMNENNLKDYSQKTNLFLKVSQSYCVDPLYIFNKFYKHFIDEQVKSCVKIYVSGGFSYKYTQFILKSQMFKYPVIAQCLGVLFSGSNILLNNVVATSSFDYGLELLIPMLDSGVFKIEPTLMTFNDKSYIVNGCKILINKDNMFKKNQTIDYKQMLSVFPTSSKDKYLDIVIYEFQKDNYLQYSTGAIYDPMKDPVGGFHIQFDELDFSLDRKLREYRVFLRLNPNLQLVIMRMRNNKLHQKVQDLQIDGFQPLKFQFKTRRHTMFLVDCSGSMKMRMNHVYEPTCFKNKQLNMVGAIVDTIIQYLKSRQDYVDDCYSLISFNSEAQILLKHQQNPMLVVDELNKLNICGNSDVSTALEKLSQVVLLNKPQYEQTVLVLTDGDIDINKVKYKDILLLPEMDFHFIGFGDFSENDFNELQVLCHKLDGQFHRGVCIDDLKSIFYFVSSE